MLQHNPNLCTEFGPNLQSGEFNAFLVYDGLKLFFFLLKAHSINLADIKHV